MALSLRLTRSAHPSTAPINPGEPVWVRELTPGERIREAKTGDVLPDGSVLLKRGDMDRMGLKELRGWIVQKVLHEQTTIVIGEDSNELSAHLLEDEAVS